ncbi:hypothetical protein ACJMK2_007241 [Sinanodonta woodiana]|uniref:Peptidase M12B domain-containing protein n=1 Tax=Sinanodonta woodiana TaxID=1069815 RepID=A0ABD3VJ67_SINWO
MRDKCVRTLASFCGHHMGHEGTNIRCLRYCDQSMYCYSRPHCIRLIVFLFVIFSLGAEHDGDGKASSCSPDDRYIMTPEFTQFELNETNFMNPWIFSDCSVKSFIKTLRQKYVQCVS